MYLDVGIQRVQLSLVSIEILCVEVAEIDCFRSISCEEMCCCPSDAQRRVGAGDYDDFAFDSATMVVSTPIGTLLPEERCLASNGDQDVAAHTE